MRNENDFLNKLAQFSDSRKLKLIKKVNLEGIQSKFQPTKIMDKLMNDSQPVSSHSPNQNNMQLVLYEDRQDRNEQLFSSFVKYQMSQMISSNEKLNNSLILKMKKMYETLTKEKQFEYKELMNEIVLMEIDE